MPEVRPLSPSLSPFLLCCGFRLANDYIVFDLCKTGISKLNSFIQLGIFDLIDILIILQKNVVLEEVVPVDEAAVDQVQGVEAFNEVVVEEDVEHREGDEEVDSEVDSEADLVEGVASVVASAVAVDEGEVVVVVVVSEAHNCLYSPAIFLFTFVLPIEAIETLQGKMWKQLVKEGISNSGMLWFQCFYFAFDNL